MQSDPEFEAVRQMTDPLAQARAAGELIGVYQQRSTELSRIRKEAMNAAVAERGITFTELAKELGLTKGRVSQIRSSAPPTERGLFGVGPLTIAIPQRAVAGRDEGVISAHDTAAADHLQTYLESLSFRTIRFLIPPTGAWTPPQDAVAICGPKSSQVTADAIEADPFLDFSPDAQSKWTLRGRDGVEFVSPLDQAKPDADIAYIARLPYKTGRLFVIAGVHALGSVGAVDYLAKNARAIYDQVGDEPFSMIVGSTYDGAEVTHSEALWGPKTH